MYNQKDYKKIYEYEDPDWEWNIISIILFPRWFNPFFWIHIILSFIVLPLIDFAVNKREIGRCYSYFSKIEDVASDIASFFRYYKI